METLVYSYRGPLKDLSYSGSAAVVNSEGKLLFYCGEPQKTVYMLSLIHIYGFVVCRTGQAELIDEYLGGFLPYIGKNAPVIVLF